MIHNSLQAIGAAIAEARHMQKKSQSELAKSLGISRSTISGIENATIREIGVRKLMALCASVGLELSVRSRGRPTLQELQAEHLAEYRANQNRS